LNGVSFLGVVLALLALASPWIGGLTMAELSQQWFADCSNNILFKIAIFLLLLGFLGCANYFRYAAFGPYRSFGGFSRFATRVIWMTVWSSLAVLTGLYLLMYHSASPQHC